VESEKRMHLDHASLRVSSFDAARAKLERLGLELTRTPQAAERHGRVLFHRGYVEVSVPQGEALGPGVEGTLPLFFLNAENLPALAERLRTRGLPSTPRTYAGVDGLWEELLLETPPTLPVPLIIRRVEPPEIARDWPPPRETPHPCGALTLEAVVGVTGQLDLTWEYQKRLLGLEGELHVIHDAHYNARRGEVWLPRCRWVLLEPSGPGLAQHALNRQGPGPLGFQLGVLNVLQTEDFYAARGLRLTRVNASAQPPERWLDPAETFGISLGFVPASPPR